MPKTAKYLACLLPLLAGAAHAQDERRIASPDGQIEFRLFTSVPEGSGLNCLAYQVRIHGQPVVDTSYLGMNIHYQEPLLGENVGLSADKRLQGTGYNGLWADYLQTSTTGRRIQFEVRVWNDGAAFRYTIPPSPLLMDLLIEDDATEFRFAHSTTGDRPAHAAIPYSEQEPGIGWVGIFGQEMQGFPKMQLVRSDAHTMSAHLPDNPHDPGVAFEGKTPWTSPWHIIVIGPERDGLAKSDILRDMLR